VGNIDRRTEKRDLEQEFGRFGKIRQIQIWADRHPAGFAFVEYEDDRDAEDAIKDLDDRQFLGSRLRVEWARSTGRKPPPRKRSPAARRGGSYRRSPSPPPRNRRSRYSIIHLFLLPRLGVKSSIICTNYLIHLRFKYVLSMFINLNI